MAMARKIPKFTGALAEPIKMGRLSLLKMTAEEQRAAIAKINTDLLARRIDKLPALLRHYGWKGGKLGEVSAGQLLGFIARLACDFIPGFQTVDEAARTKGRPRKHDSESLEALLHMIDIIKKLGLATTDQEACAVHVECSEDPPRRRTDREKRARSLANLVSQARASAKRKESKAIH